MLLPKEKKITQRLDNLQTNFYKAKFGSKLKGRVSYKGRDGEERMKGIITDTGTLAVSE